VFSEMFGGWREVDLAMLQRGGYRLMRNGEQLTAFVFGVFRHGKLRRDGQELRPT
jgi:hypothetical protein